MVASGFSDGIASSPEAVIDIDSDTDAGLSEE